MPEKRDPLACGVDLHNADTRKGAESERAAVDVPRFASFARMETVTKAGLKASKKLQPETPVAGDKGGGSRECHEKRKRMRTGSDEKPISCMKTCKDRLFVFKTHI